MIRILCIVLVLLCAPGNSTWAEPFDDVAAAHQRGDFEAALELVMPLANEGDPGAQTILGSYYYLGNGVPQDYAEAANWFMKAARQGNADAQVMLGTQYLSGFGVLQNETEAEKWYNKAAEQGNIEAMLMLGFYYAPPPPKGDSVKSYMWLLIAAEQGSWEAFGALFAADDEMTADQIAEAKRMARDWMAKHPQ